MSSRISSGVFALPSAIRPGGRADLPGRAVTALECVVIDESLLQRMQRAVSSKALIGGDFAPSCITASVRQELIRRPRPGRCRRRTARGRSPSWCRSGPGGRATHRAALSTVRPRVLPLRPLMVNVIGIFPGTAAIIHWLCRAEFAPFSSPPAVLGMSYPRVSTMTFAGPLVVRERKRLDFSSLDYTMPIYNELRRRRFKEIRAICQARRLIAGRRR